MVLKLNIKVFLTIQRTKYIYLYLQITKTVVCFIVLLCSYSYY